MNNTDSPDKINPPHYAHHTIQPIDVIEDWVLPHHLACCVKYFARYREKGEPMSDLYKAKWYMDRFVELMDRLHGDED